MLATDSGQRKLNGLAAAAVAVGLTQFIAAPLGQDADALNSVGSAVIDLTPGPVKEWAIQLFGTADKLFLSILVLAIIAVLAAVAGELEARRPWAGCAFLVGGGVLGCAAVLSRVGGGPADVIPTVVGTLAGVLVLRVLTRKTAARTSAPKDAAPKDAAPEDAAPEAGENPLPDPGRRLSLVAIGLLAVGTAAVVGGRVLSRALHSVAGERAAAPLPKVSVPAPPIPPAVQPAGVTLPSFVTSNEDFYRIDTALLAPQVSREEWQLRIHGMVDNEVTFTFDDLEEFEVIEKVVTLACVSNPIGGDLISNAVWTGYRVRDLLAKAGVKPDSDMVLSTSVDGFTVGTPVEALTDNRDALLAITMNGVPLPVEHGYPARLVVPGLYGYVSATKWVTDLELTRFDQAQAYWTKLGWSAKGPIKTSSRIDVPRDGQTVPPGPTTFGGVAWAQNRGVRAVEVQIDDNGPWQQAELGESYSNETWRLWSFPWTATPGKHTVSVRAVDNTGAVQIEQWADVVPDGATGWQQVGFTVE